MNIQSIVASLPSYLRRHKLIQLLLLISPNSRIQLIQFNGTARLFADLRDPWCRQILITEHGDPEFVFIAAKFLSNGGVFFDVGANFGFLSFGLMAELLNSNINYHLFEANDNIYRLLVKSKTLYTEQNIWLNNCCITDKYGYSKLKIDSNNGALSFISAEGDREVKNILLDDYISTHSVQKVNFLKMDIEGHEPWAIKGAMKSIESGLVEVIYLEVSSLHLSRSGFCVSDLFKLLKELGFKLFYVKRSDFESGIANRSKISTLNVHGSPLIVAEVEKFPDEYQTDILAVHKTTKLALGSGKS